MFLGASNYGCWSVFAVNDRSVSNGALEHFFTRPMLSALLVLSPPGPSEVGTVVNSFYSSPR